MLAQTTNLVDVMFVTVGATIRPVPRFLRNGTAFARANDTETACAWHA